MQSPLAQALRERTRRLHAEAERSGLMQAMLRGQVLRPAYCVLLRNLHDIYLALEGALARQAFHPWIAPIHIAGLARGAALANDLQELQGERWARQLPQLPSTRDYVGRLQSLERDSPGHLLAHAYVRYLGDLSGGQVLRRMVSRSLGLEGNRGTGFYDFGGAQATQELAQRFRRGLDAVAVDADGIALLALEAQWSFRAHAALFQEVGAAA